MNTNSMTNNHEGCRKAFGTTDSEVTKGINRREMYQTSLCAINDKSNSPSVRAVTKPRYSQVQLLFD